MLLASAIGKPRAALVPTASRMGTEQRVMKGTERNAPPAPTSAEMNPMPAPTEDWRSLPTPERAERMLTRMKAHEAQMSAHVDALKTFYATLTPEQKKTFDAAHAVGPRGMKGRMGPGMMGGGTGGRMSDRP